MGIGRGNVSRSLKRYEQMFQILKPNAIESDTGFAVEVLGRTGLLYSEDNRKMKIDSEVLQGPSGLLIYTDSIVNWLPPHEGETIDDAYRNCIVENIKSAFRFRGLEIQVQ